MTFGFACSPFLASRMLKQLALDEANSYPLGSQILDKEVYADDILFGDFTLEKARNLQKRIKWQGLQAAVKVGDIVLLRHENTAPTRWPLARVTEVFPGADGLVRVVTVRTATTTLRRPIAKLVKLIDFECPQVDETQDSRS